MPVNRAATAGRASRFTGQKSRRVAGEGCSRSRYAPHAVVTTLTETTRQVSRRQHQALFVVGGTQYRKSCRPTAMHYAGSVNCAQPVKNSRRVAGEVSSPIRYAPIACSVTPLAETAAQASRQGEGCYWCCSSFLALSHTGQPRRKSRKSVTVHRFERSSFASGVPPATAYRSASAFRHAARSFVAYRSAAPCSRPCDFSFASCRASGVPPALHNQDYVFASQAGYSFT
jgi:hypothetical protein